MVQTKVIHIITRMELGGAQQNTLFTVQHLNPEMFQTYLVTGSGGEMFDEAQAFPRCRVVPALVRQVRPVSDIRALVRLTAVLRSIQRSPPEEAPVIVHTHSSKAGILGRWAARIAGIRAVVHSVHGFGFHDYQPAPVRWLYICLERVTACITTMFIAVSEANRTRGIDLKIFRPEQVRLIRSGIDISLFSRPATGRQQVRQRLGIPGQARLVTMIACLKPQKAPLDFVRAAVIVGRHVPGTHFLLVGDGVLHDEVSRMAGSGPLRDMFHMAGWRRDVCDIMHATDVFVLTSRWEGLPRVLPQAMAAGVPVVATAVDGSPEAVRDGCNGFLVAPGDVGAIADKIRYCLEHPEAARSMGVRGSRMTAEFDIHAMVAGQERLYEEILQLQRR